MLAMASKQNERNWFAQPESSASVVNITNRIMKPSKFKQESSKSWNVIKQKLARARVEEALTSPKIFINGNKFTILQVLGQGGYSTVYEVYDKDKNLLRFIIHVI